MFHFCVEEGETDLFLVGKQVDKTIFKCGKALQKSLIL